MRAERACGSAGAGVAGRGGLVIGSWDGFQVLTEAGVVPGALQKNRALKFLCQMTEVRVESTDSPLTGSLSSGAVSRIPINHFEGNYIDPARTLA